MSASNRRELPTITCLLALGLLAVGEPSLQELERRCQSDSDGTSCYKAAFMYAFAMGVEKDLPKAAKACSAGNKPTCRLIERWRSQGLLP